MKTMTLSTATASTAVPVAGYAAWRLCLVILVSCVLALLTVQRAWAAEFTVDTVLDGVDSNVGDGVCENVTVVAGGACTLRAAIQEANFTPAAADIITLPAGTYQLTIENLFDNAEDAAATGDLDITTNIVINGAGARLTIIEAKDDLHDRVFHLVGDDAVAGLNYLTVRNGNTTDLLGVRDGGGILVGGGKLQAFELAVEDSTSATYGGGIMFIGVNSSTLHRCTISGNRAIAANGQGGGIYHGQNYFLNMANCTVSGNRASSRGGGIAVANNSKLITILNTTIASNQLTDDPEEGGGVYIGNNTDIHIFSSILANNYTPGRVPNDCYGQIDVLDFSLVEAPAAGNECLLAGDGENVSSLLGSADPLLELLAYNGGALQTHALREGSIAIDAGNQLAPGSGGRACYGTDARGQMRPAREYCDMGSFELPEYLYMPKLDK